MANLTPMQDQAQSKTRPLLLRHHRADFSFDLHSVGLAGQAQPAREARDVSVDSESRDVEGNAQHHIGGFATNTGQLDEIFHPSRHLTPVALDDSACRTHDGFCLLAEEAGWLDQPFKLGRVGVGEVLDSRVAAKEPGGNHVDPLVGALGAEDGCHQQLPRTVVDERGPGLWIVNL